MEQKSEDIAFGKLANLPMVKFRGSCNMDRHGNNESWTVEARTGYTAAVQLRTKLAKQGRIMPADLDWTIE